MNTYNATASAINPINTQSETMSHGFVQLTPYDEHNQKLEANVSPPQWQNPQPTKPYHLVVIGAGTAGLVTAAGAAGLGARVALIERALMGGDCLNVGCVPSKGLIAAGRVAATVRDASQFGVETADNPKVDFAIVMARMRKLRAKISPVDSAQRFADLGIDVYFGAGQFVDDNTITVTTSEGSTRQLNYKKAVIATGARAFVPPIPGLDQVSYLTNENLFSLTELPEKFGIVGSGPIGAEMAQSFARFGSEVFLFERQDRILGREDAEASAVVQKQLEHDGVRLMLNSEDMKLSPADGGKIRVTVSRNGKQEEIVLDQLLISTGRTPNTGNLNLEGIGVEFDRGGVTVNDNLQTTNKKVFAAGDVCSKYKFTHAADFMARIVIQNALFAVGPFGKKKASDLLIPWATYTAPGIAHVGMYEHDAKEAGIEIDTYTQHFSDIDRAILEGQDEGFVKIHTRRGTDKIIGATIVAEHAGDLISQLTMAMKNKIGLGKIASIIHPYPTKAEAIRKLGDAFNKTRLTKTSKGVLDVLRRFNVGT